MSIISCLLDVLQAQEIINFEVPVENFDSLFVTIRVFCI
jgi:hypothetical protein